MIKISKGDSPQELIDASNALVTQMKASYDESPQDYLTGTKTFGFTSAYKSAKVKRLLIEKQHNKCCFSEAKFVNDDSHVEHFRPKGRVDTWPNGAQFTPGYYWLAYDWSNLFLCKSTTNSSVKRNFFPLEDDTIRNKNHNEVNIEVPLLIDPSVDNPRDHIRFKNEEPYGISNRGKKTIEILDLRNSELKEARRTKIHLLTTIKDAIDLLLTGGSLPTDPEIIPLINTLKDSVSPQAEFSSMAIDALQGWPHLT